MSQNIPAINNDLFYSRLPVNEIPLSDLLMEEHLFFRIPANWYVVITDVKNSTLAIREGLHETVNLIATGSIVAVLNIVYKNNLTVPFFFGGDGASFIIPPALLEPAMQALFLYRENTKATFNLDLRVGYVQITEIYEQQHELNIGKLRTSGLFAIPVLLGDGLTYAEKKIKGPDYKFALLPAPKEELDLSGMQCRWDRIKPPENFFEVVSLLVIARDGVKQSSAFKKVMDSIDAIYGAPQTRKPISIQKLKLKATLAKIRVEMRARMGGFRPFYLLINWIKTLLGIYYFKTKKGKVYLHNLVDMSDTLVIDGKINTVITGTSQQRELLEAALNKIESDGEILYGLYVSKESVMSCYVRNMNDKHVHFVDGAEGGYTNAAGVIKQKMIKAII
ncbi:MAG TPA: DUF3095 domain-containing protein [Chitinophagaceae bacterium]|nr:DUF3095 domain-containing protein [Chitinophagaceae bacterium]